MDHTRGWSVEQNPRFKNQEGLASGREEELLEIYLSNTR